MSIRHHRQRVAIAGLGVLLLIADHASAQDPYAPPPPQWTVDAGTNSMVLAPTGTAKLAVGLSSAQSKLHVVNSDVTASPERGP